MNGHDKTNGAGQDEQAVSVREAVGKSLTAGAVEVPNGDHPDEGEEGEGEVERVTIRSLDEEVAVGGKNFSTSPSFSIVRCRMWEGGIWTS